MIQLLQILQIVQSRQSINPMIPITSNSSITLIKSFTSIFYLSNLIYEK